MTEFYWTEVKEHAIRVFDGELPNAKTEADIVEVFERRPQSVVNAVDDVAAGKQNGHIRSGWAVLRSRVLDGGTRDVVATDESERELKVRNALAWVATAGLHFEKQDELEDELFGERGRLRMFAHDVELRAGLVARWQQLRPSGVRVEEEAVRRGREFVERREQVRAAVEARRAELEQAEQAPAA